MDAKERREKIRQAIFETLSEIDVPLSFSRLKKGVNARIPKVHKYFLEVGLAAEREWNLEISEILQELRREGKVKLVGTDYWVIQGG